MNSELNAPDPPKKGRWGLAKFVSQIEPLKFSSPLRLLVILMLVVLITEAIVILIFTYLRPATAFLEAVFHALVTTALIFPAFYFFSFRPLLSQIEERRRAEEALRQVNDNLELRIQERTVELLDANQALQKEILERKLVEAQLRLQTTAVEAADNGIIITDRQGTIQWCNPAFTRMTGYTLEEVIGHTSRLLKSGAHDADFYKSLWDTITAQQVWHGEIINRRKDGRLYTEEQTITPVLDNRGELTHFIGIKQDISERKLAEQALEAERKRLFALLDELPATVYLKGADYSIRYANHRFRERFGDPGSAPCYRLIFQRETPCDYCPANTVFHDRRLVEWEQTFPDGRSYQIFDYPFVDMDGSVSVLELGIDITERKQVEARLEQSNRDLLALSQAENEQRQLMQGLAHISLSLSASLDLDKVLERLLSEMQEVIHYNASAVLLLSEGQVFLRHYQGADLPDNLNYLTTGSPLDSLTLLKTVVQERASVLIGDTQNSPEWTPIKNLDWVRSFLAAPLMAGEQILGVVALISAQADFFNQQHLRWAEAVLAQASFAIQNAELFGEIRSSRERLKALSRQLVEVQENERRYIARELHDEASQALSSLMVGLQLLEREIDRPQAVQQRVAELQRVVDAVLENLHRLAVGLRPASLDYLGLAAALRQFIDTLYEQYKLNIQLETVNLAERLPMEMENTLYRIVQEALTNVVRHAQASQVGVLIERRDGKIITIIEDNGLGFTPQVAQDRGRLGLFGMRERAEMLGGQLAIESRPGSGTTIFVELPYAD